MSLTYDQQLYFRKVTQDLGVPEGQANFEEDIFTGDGSTLAFTLTQTPDVTNYTPVVLLNNTQQSGSQISISGTTLTFVTAPVLNTVIEVNYQY